MDTTRDWERLGKAANHRRLDIGHPDLKEFVAANPGLSTRTVQAVEYAERPGFSKRTKYLLEKALYWAPGSVDEILAGREPVELPLPTPEESPLSRLRPAELVAQINERLNELASRVPSDMDVYDPNEPGMREVAPGTYDDLPAHSPSVRATNRAQRVRRAK